MMNSLLRLHVWSSTLLTCPRSTDRPVVHLSDEDTTDPSSMRRSGLVPVDRGQATTEYALVMLGAAVVALLVVSWATAGGGAGKIGRLFDRVIDGVVSRV